MKKILALIGLLSLGACASYSEENAFDNRQYMLDEGKYSKSQTILGDDEEDDRASHDNSNDNTPQAPSAFEQDTPYAETVAAQDMTYEERPRYQVVEAAPYPYNEPIPLETASAPVSSNAYSEYVYGPSHTAPSVVEPLPLAPDALPPAANTPPPTQIKISGEDIAVYGSNVPPTEHGRHIQLREVIDQPREYKKYKDVFLVDTPRGTVNLWEETVSPEVYEVVATRITNRMLQETEELYSGQITPSIYVGEVTSPDGVVDNGFYLSRKIINDILIGTKNYKVAASQAAADYYLSLEVVKHELDYGVDKVLEFKMTMYDKKHKRVQEFSELMQQIKNDDRSWW